MTIDISFFGFIRFYFAFVYPWCVRAIRSKDKTGWHYCSLYFSIPSDDSIWDFGWVWETNFIAITFGPWQWEKFR